MKLEEKKIKNTKSEKTPLLSNVVKIFPTAYRINNTCEPLIFNLDIHPYIPPIEREYKQVQMTENRWKFMNILLFL